MKTIGPDPHGDLSTGTGHSKEGIRHDHEVANQKIKLTKEEQDIWDGKQGPVMARLKSVDPIVSPPGSSYPEWLSKK